MTEPTEVMWLPEPVIAYKGWEVRGGYLASMFGPWVGDTQEGQHKDRSTTGVEQAETHDAPHWDCRCGINAYKDPYSAMDYPAIGQMRLWGRTIEYEHGYRAQWGQIISVAIYLPYAKMLLPDFGPDEDQALAEMLKTLRTRYPNVVIDVTGRLPDEWKGRTNG